MMLIDRRQGTIGHFQFAEITRFVKPADLLVLNDTKVIPARLHDPTGQIEILLLEQRDPNHWTAMVKPGKKMRLGVKVRTAGTTATVLAVLEDGIRLLRFDEPPDLERYGLMPIPPYFRRAADAEDSERYQTIYAINPGSVAAPTAGLHFTAEILAGLPHCFMTLHVGAGTFRPVQTTDLSAHRMHSERYTLPERTATRINDAQRSGGRILAVGTTTIRVLESQPSGPLRGTSDSTNIFIRPPHNFKWADALLTNFHLPGSTLLMLVSAFAGHELIRQAYQEAIRARYRFFSYGDCMLIL